MDSRWEEFANRHPQASVFHQQGWLRALSLTYDYVPFVLTSASADEPLTDGVVLCRVSSWITGTRLVSVPFADHCEPLVTVDSDFSAFSDYFQKECRDRKLSYVELRPLTHKLGCECSFKPASAYWVHTLDTRPCLHQIARQLHKNSFQRKIHRAQREGLSHEVGVSSPLLDDFCRLLLITRRRHQLLPQPRRWFENLIACMGDRVQIRVTSKNGIAVAAMLTLRHGSCVVYKYGCSDHRFHNLGGMAFLFWKLIEECRASGIERIDLGRSDMTNEGLIAFKDRLGAKRELVTYYRYAEGNTNPERTWGVPGLPRLLALIPDAVLSTAGRLIYRHIG